jgi:hypothetical protein
MRKIAIFIAIVVFASSLNSCASKKKGCGLTAEHQSVSLKQELDHAEVTTSDSY